MGRHNNTNIASKKKAVKAKATLKKNETMLSYIEFPNYEGNEQKLKNQLFKAGKKHYNRMKKENAWKCKSSSTKPTKVALKEISNADNIQLDIDENDPKYLMKTTDDINKYFGGYDLSKKDKEYYHKEYMKEFESWKNTGFTVGDRRYLPLDKYHEECESSSSDERWIPHNKEGTREWNIQYYKVKENLRVKELIMQHWAVELGDMNYRNPNDPRKSVLEDIYNKAYKDWKEVNDPLYVC